MRSSAFGVVNKLDAHLPRTKIAIIKRTYTNDAVNGWCPDPEARWAELPNTILESAEELLRYLHQTEAIRERIDPETAGAAGSFKRTIWYGNVVV